MFRIMPIVCLAGLTQKHQVNSTLARMTTERQTIIVAALNRYGIIPDLARIVNTYERVGAGL